MKLSIIICAYNREIFISDALMSLVNQTTDKSIFEVIVVNNNSTDNTKNVVLDIINKFPETKIIYTEEYNQGLTFARNKGIQEAKGEIISFIDDDGKAEPDYVSNLLKAFEKYPQFDSLGGKILPIYPNYTEPIWMSKYIDGIVSKVDWGNKFGPFVKHKYPFGCNMAFKRQLFESVGLFNTELSRSDDKFMFLKLKKHGKTILYAPNVIVNHHIDNFRIEKSYIKKISYNIGSNERIRLNKTSLAERIKKPVEFFIKFFVAIFIAVGFILKGKPAKATYIILIRWWVIVGYFKN